GHIPTPPRAKGWEIRQCYAFELGNWIPRHIPQVTRIMQSNAKKEYWVAYDEPRKSERHDSRYYVDHALYLYHPEGKNYLDSNRDYAKEESAHPRMRAVEDENGDWIWIWYYHRCLEWGWFICKKH